MLVGRVEEGSEAVTSLENVFMLHYLQTGVINC